MADGPLALAGLTPSIPWRGLEEVFAAWSGQGQLWRALAAVDLEREWSPQDSRRRAMRVLMAQLVPALSRWPRRTDDWVNALPATTETRRGVALAPTAGVIWPDTRRRSGWPPREFVIKPKRRVADTLLATATRWTLDELTAVREDAQRAEPRLEEPIARQLSAFDALRTVPAVGDVPPIEPSGADVRALSREGRPWSRMAPVTAALRTIREATILELARRLVAPTDDAARLFHLGVLGEVLIALRAEGAQVTSLRPLSGASPGPAYAVIDASRRRWELWFEAAGAWSHYGIEDPYKAAVVGVPGSGSALGCDVALLLPGADALLIECKYSTHGTYVGRDGYRAAVAYAAEATGRLTQRVTSIVVGPAAVVRNQSWTTLDVGAIGVLAPSDIHGCVRRLLLGNGRSG